MTPMVVMTFEHFRRTRFEWFYYTHHLFPLVIIFSCWHCWAAHKGGQIMQYGLAAVVLYIVDRVIRVYRFGCECRLVRLLIPFRAEVAFRSTPRCQSSATNR